MAISRALPVRWSGTWTPPLFNLTGGESIGNICDQNVSLAPGEMVKANPHIHMAENLADGDYDFTTVFGATGQMEEPTPSVGPVHHWPGEGNANDVVGGQHGALEGGATFAAGMVGQAFSLDGNDDWVQLVSAQTLGMTDSDFTVAAWVYLTNPRHIDPVLGTLTGARNEGLHLAAAHGGQNPYMGFWFNDTGGTTVISADTWYHLAWRYTKATGEQAIFVDGALDTKRTGHAPFEGIGTVYIGRSVGSQPFTGLIDEVKIFNRPLTDAEIAADFGGGVKITKTQDTNDGTCDAADCSLREAIAAADSGDTIIVPAGTYTLTLGVLSVGKNLTLAGAGQDTTIIQASAVNPVLLPGDPGVANHGVLSISGERNVAISDVTIRHGNGGQGGGINNHSGTVTLTNVTVSGNNGPGGGGGIYSHFGTVNLINSTVSGNLNDCGVGGGGITIGLPPGSLTLTNSTVSGNSSSCAGGGIYHGQNWQGGTTTLTITNSTISGNSVTDGSIGGIYAGGMVTITNSTISGNTASVGTGGIVGVDETNIRNTTIAGNSAGLQARDCGGTLASQGHNLVQDTTGCTITGDPTGNITGEDPLLGPLSDNGGSTLTYALQVGSPAIDKGDDSVAPPTDQRGVARVGTSDIGSFEFVP